MLNRLVIKNLAIVKKVELYFDYGLNVLSGETGAGKSIIVDALMLLLGGKYDKSMLSYGEESGYVEGTFVFKGEAAKLLFEQQGIDSDEEDLIVRRRFSSDGKNDIKVNGMSFTVGMLKNLMGSLVDICGQNEYQILSKKKEHMAMLDSYASKTLEPLLEEYSRVYSSYRDTALKLESIGNAGDRLTKIDILKYQIDEIEKVNVKEGEEDELIEERTQAMHIEKIKSALMEAVNALTRDEGGIDSLSTASSSVSSISSYAPVYSELYGRLSSAKIEISDIASELEDKLSETDESMDLDSIEKRLYSIRQIKSKYGDISKLDAKLKKMKEELQFLSNADEEYENLTALKEKYLSDMYAKAKVISGVRREYAVKFQSEVLSELSELGFYNAKFEVAFSPVPPQTEFERVCTRLGFDDCEFLLSPNLGQPLLPLIKIISGGEMSRFMLALKVISSKNSTVDTIIFDEIDTGISGKTGLEVAKKLAKISRHDQVLCVTHLAQIAAMADQHYFIEKKVADNSTYTEVTPLDDDEIIKEISRISGSGGVSSLADASAKELKNWCNEYKSKI